MPVPRPALAAAAALLLGALGNLLFGASPTAIVPVAAPTQAWNTQWRAAEDLAAADAVWKGDRSPWGAPPKPPAAAAPPPPPPATPVGVVGGGEGAMAVFMLPGQEMARLAVGDKIPGGGQLLEVAGQRIVWLDAGGVRRERVLFDGSASKP